MEFVIEKKALQSVLSQADGELHLLADKDSGMVYTVCDFGLYQVKTGAYATVKESGAVKVDCADLRRISSSIGDSAVIRVEETSVKILSVNLEATIPASSSGSEEDGQGILKAFSSNGLKHLFTANPEILDSLLQGAFVFHPAKMKSNFNVFEFSRSGNDNKFLQCTSVTGIFLSSFRMPEEQEEDEEHKLSNFKVYLPLMCQKLIRTACRWAAEKAERVSVYETGGGKACLVSTDSGRIAFLVPMAADARFPDPAAIAKLFKMAENQSLARVCVNGEALVEAFELCAGLSVENESKTLLSVTPEGSLRICNLTGKSTVVRKVDGSLESGGPVSSVINSEIAASMVRRILQAGDTEEVDVTVCQTEPGGKHMLLFGRKWEENYHISQVLMSFEVAAGAQGSA